jgi:PKD repeat protein
MIVTWLWEFGDGMVSYGYNPSHFYAVPGTFMAKLTVTDITGCTGEIEKPVTVLSAGSPPPAFQSITNINVGSGQSKCYNATQVIYVAGNGTPFNVLSGGIATFIAGQKIAFLPGTAVQNGGSLLGYISPSGPFCVNPNLPSVVSTGDQVSAYPGHSSFTIYPNPTTGTFIVVLDRPEQTSGVRIEVYGTCGENVLTSILNGEQKHQFSLSGMSAGIYFIRVIAGNSVETGKIIKQ